MLIEHREYGKHGVTGDPIKNLFAFAPGFHERFVPQNCQLLREGGLLYIKQFLELTDTSLALSELTEQHQSIRIGHHSHQRTGPVGGSPHRGQIEVGGHGHGMRKKEKNLNNIHENKL